LASKAPDTHLDLGTPVELEMPLESYWKLEEILKEFAYLQSSNENPTELAKMSKKIFRHSAPFIVTERSRIWMQEKLNEE
jgi:hypothetical protein